MGRNNTKENNIGNFIRGNNTKENNIGNFIRGNNTKENNSGNFIGNAYWGGVSLVLLTGPS